MKNSPSTRPCIEYFFSFVSSWSYVGSLAFQELVGRSNADVRYKPINLAAVVAAGGGVPVRERSVQRQAYRLVEMRRWSEVRRIPLVLHPKFYPADPSLGHRMLLAGLRRGHDVHAFSHTCLKAVWADELDIADANTLARLAEEAALPGRELLDEAQDPALRDVEEKLNEEAIRKLVFGAPFYFYRGEPFWGQDRIEHMEAVVASNRPPVLSTVTSI